MKEQETQEPSFTRRPTWSESDPERTNSERRPNNEMDNDASDMVGLSQRI